MAIIGSFNYIARFGFALYPKLSNSVLIGKMHGRRTKTQTDSVLVQPEMDIWLALLLAAMGGTSRSTPIAGAGFTGAPWQEMAVTLLLTSASVAIIVATGLMPFGLFTKLNSRQ